MLRIKDLTGLVFERLTVVRLSHIDEKQNSRWVCKCSCGNEMVVRGFQLTGGKSRSCGCLQREVTSKLHTTHGATRKGKRIPEYSVWASMLARCKNPENPAYKDYGARGISVCDEWHSFEYFIRDMGRRPNIDYSIERIDNELGYSKSNCKWATRAEQSRNTRRNVSIDTPKGPMLVCDAAIEFGITQETLRSRIRRGVPTEQLFAPTLTRGKS